MSLFVKKTNDSGAVWPTVKNIYVKTTNATGAQWSTVKAGYIKIDSSQWAQFWPINSVVPQIQNNSGAVLDSSAQITSGYKLYGYIGSTNVGTYYYEWESVVATSFTPPSSGWVAETGTGASGSVVQSNSNKQTVTYTTKSTDIQKFIRLRIVNNGNTYYSNIVYVAPGFLPAATLSATKSTGDGFTFYVTNYSTFTSGTYANAVPVIAGLGNSPLEDDKNDIITTSQYSIDVTGKVIFTNLSPGVTVTGEIYFTLFPYGPGTPNQFTGHVNQASAYIQHSFTPDPTAGLPTGNITASVQVDFALMNNAVSYNATSVSLGQETDLTNITSPVIFDGNYRDALAWTISGIDAGGNVINTISDTLSANGNDSPVAPTNIVTSSKTAGSYTISWNRGAYGTTTHILYINGSPVKTSSAASDSYTGTTNSTSVNYSFDAINNWSGSGFSGSYARSNVASGTVSVMQGVVVSSVDINQTLVIKGGLVTASVGTTGGVPSYYDIYWVDGGGNKISGSDSGPITLNYSSYSIPNNYAYSTITAYGTAYNSSNSTPYTYVGTGIGNPATVATPVSINVTTVNKSYGTKSVDISWPPVTGANSYEVVGSSDGTHILPAGPNPLTDTVTSTTYTVQFTVYAYSGANMTGSVIGYSQAYSIPLTAPFTFAPAFTFVPAFTFTPAGTAPQITSSSSTATSVSVVATGTAPLSYQYQWYNGDTGKLVVTHTSSSSTDTYSNALGGWYVIVTVSNGITPAASTTITIPYPAFSFTPVFTFTPAPVFTFTPAPVFTFSPFSFVPAFSFAPGRGPRIS